MSKLNLPEDVFDELKNEAIKIWKTYDDTYGYATEKIETINRLKNFSDNWGTIVGMFDSDNQRKLYNAVGDQAKQAIIEWTGGMF